MADDATIGELLFEAGAAFRKAEPPPARRDAVLLLARILGRPESWVRAHPEAVLGPRTAERARELIGRRARGEPFAYLVGEREFWGRSFRVDDRVLVPRPETEHLVEAVLDLAQKRELPPKPWILDLGVGSGAIACTLAAELPGARVVATDISLGALAVAFRNRERLVCAPPAPPRRLGPPGTPPPREAPSSLPRPLEGGPGGVLLAAADLAAPLRLDRFDLVVSNPPYLDPDSPEVEAHVRRFEPSEALWAEDRGRGVLRRLLGLRRGLREGAWLVLEIGHDQGAWISSTASGLGWSSTSVLPDLAGRDRTAVLQA